MNVERAENAIELKEVEGLSQGKIVTRRFVRHKAAMASIVLLIAIIGLAFSSVGLDVGTEDVKIQTTGWWKYGYCLSLLTALACRLATIRLVKMKLVAMVSRESCAAPSSQSW
ncbi:MAG: hypothetical protein RLZZ90_1088 [Actinomycetota bacterium]